MSNSQIVLSGLGWSHAGGFCKHTTICLSLSISAVYLLSCAGGGVRSHVTFRADELIYRVRDIFMFRTGDMFIFRMDDIHI